MYARSVPRAHVLAPALLALAAVPLCAQDRQTFGPRSLAMGGTGVAVADDHTVGYQNPAALGFFGRVPVEDALLREDTGERRIARVDNQDLGRKDFGFGVDVQAGLSIHGRLAETAQLLADSDFRRLGQNGVQSQADVAALIDIGHALASIDEPANAVSLDVSAGTGLRFGHVAIGARLFSQAYARVESLDLVNLGFGQGSGTLATQINTNAPAPSGYVPSVFTPAQQAQLSAALGGGANGTTAMTALDYQTSQRGLSPADVDAMFPLLLGAAQAGLAQSLDNNTTAFAATGYGLAELPISYGYAFDDALAIGITARVLFARVYGARTRVFTDDLSEALAKARDSYRASTNVGIDAGALWRSEGYQLGLRARNLNAPRLKAPEGFRDVTLDPELTLGAALIPHETLCITGEIDLLEVRSILPGYTTRTVAAGLEWNAGHFIALRGGIASNLAETDIGPLISAGVGIDLYLLRIDLSAATSLSQATYDGQTYPKEARVGFQVACDF